VIPDIDERLEKRLGHLHARLRLGIEADHEAQVFGQGINYFHIENLPPSHIAIRSCLKLTGLYGRGHKNAAQIDLRSHDVISSRIPKAFDGFVILQLSDLHIEMSEVAMTRGDAPDFVEVGEAGIAVDHAMRRPLAVQSCWWRAASWQRARPAQP